MPNNGHKQSKKSWEELVSQAAVETDPERIANIAEEIFAALEERERTQSQRQTENP
jgi:hypothetical protein